MNAMPATNSAQARKRALVALSGGVDSSVCVYLMQNAGYDVAGVVLRMSPAHDGTVAAAQESAAALGIPLFIEDMAEPFHEQVVQYFIREYQNARTPNPCVVCNPLVKFKALADCAQAHGFDHIVTGHYAGVTKEPDGGFALRKAECLARDQSYMLYRLDQRVLSRLLLPLAHLPKDKVRSIAAELGLSCASKPDSQEICFIPDNDYAGYIEKCCGRSEPGVFIGPDGKPCGVHKGIIHYTVGQRKGLGIALGRPVFITRICPDTREIHLGWAGEQFSDSVYVENLTYIDGNLRDKPFFAGVKIRSVAKEVPSQITPMPGGRALVEFSIPQKAPAPGQSAVFYDGDRVLGGGFMRASLENK